MTPSFKSRSRLRSPSREHRKRIVVFTEGEKTEPSYLRHWARSNRENVIVEIVTRHGVPWTLVKEASQRRRQDREFGGVGSSNTEYWCVFDRNSHLKIADSIQMARDNDVNVAMSNPCIELWFILHFRDQRRHIEGDRAKSESRVLLGWSKKSLPTAVLDVLKDQFEDARRRAQALDEMHVGDGRPQRSNPSSDVWRLVDRIRGS